MFLPLYSFFFSCLSWNHSPEFYLFFPSSLPFYHLSTTSRQTQMAEILDRLGDSKSIHFTTEKGNILSLHCDYSFSPQIVSPTSSPVISFSPSIYSLFLSLIRK